MTILVKRIFNFHFYEDEESLQIVENLIDALRIILEINPEAAKAMTSGSTFLHQALRYEGLVKSTPLTLFSTSLKLLIESYPLATQVYDRSGRLPLHIACLYARNDEFHGPILGLYRLLLISYPDAAFFQDIYGKTPLHYHLEFQQKLEREYSNDHYVVKTNHRFSRINVIYSRMAVAVLWKAACKSPLVFIAKDSTDETPLSLLCKLINYVESDREGLEIFSTLKITTYYALLRENPERIYLLT